jgi:lysophospholipid acyltransferase (LPLAT)-like uncharacterized protein
MTQRHRWLIRPLAAIFAWVIRLWMKSMRATWISVDGRRHPAEIAGTRYIYAFWHEGLLAPLAVPTPQIRVLISHHVDGEFIAQVCQRVGIGVVRGSPSKGGSQALLDMIREGGESTHLGITPDGPRGPRRELKPGVVMVASQSGMPIVLIGIGFVKAWRFGSWDQLALPVPGSTMVGVVSEPMEIPRDLDRQALKQWTRWVEERLREMTALAEDWADRIRREGPQAAAPLFAPLPARRQSA